MKAANIIFIAFIKLSGARINIEVITGNNSDVSINYSGIDIRVVNSDDIRLFNIDENNLMDAVDKHYERRPNNVYLKKPTPWNLYETYKWEEVSRVLTVKSAKVKRIHKTPVLVMSHYFENNFQNTIKVNTGMSQAVENTLSTSWTKEKEFMVSQEIEYSLNVICAKASGTTGFSYTSSWGESEEKSEKITIGSTGAVETELQPGQTVTAMLTANRGYLEIEVVYSMFLRGNVAVNFKHMYRNHHFWGPPVENVMTSGGLTNERSVKETIKVAFYTDATLKVYDKVTGLPL